LALFANRPFSGVERLTMEAMESEIDAEDEQYLLNANEEQYLEHLASKYEIEPLEVNFDHAYATDEERSVPAENFPSTANVSYGRSYRKPVFTFHLPFSGATGLWITAPNPGMQWNPEVELRGNDNTINLDLVQFGDSVEPVNREYDTFVRNLNQQLSNLKNNVNDFNSSLRNRARARFNRRKAELKRRAENRAALRVPIRRNTAPATFAVPVKAPKRIAPRPPVSGDKYSIDPTLDALLYQEILQLLHDFGKQLERLPRTYEGKNEETLRDHFLLVLQPHFGLEGSATGETFNAAGKTDILIRYQNQNLFVAEFKFWHGQKQHLETIDQLLSYLTWRDSKTAIVYFIDGKEVTATLGAIEEATPRHPSFVAQKSKKEDSWFSYEFHLQDKKKIVQVAILCFHLLGR
jgi:hypothetical protein